MPKRPGMEAQFSHSLRPHGLQHVRFPCPSPTPRACSNSCPLSWWCHWIISSSVIPFSSCLQFFPASGSFQMSQFFASGGQSIGVSASTSVLPMNTQDRSPLGWTGWISLQSKGLSGVFSNTPYPCCFFEHSVMSSSLQPHGLWPDRLLCQWDFSGKNTRVGCHFFLQGIFLTPESNPLLMNLLHCKWILYCWATGEALLLVKKTYKLIVCK